MVLTREPGEIALLGAGESSDAYHISAPHPQGEGAIRAITQALNEAGMTADDIGYINLHGTATPLNDRIEAQVIHDLFGERVPCSSTKHLTGHTLGAAGITEAALSWLILTRNLPLPPQDFSRYAQDDTLPACGLLHAPAPLKNRRSCRTRSRLAATTPAFCWGECDEIFIPRRVPSSRRAHDAAGDRRERHRQWRSVQRHGERARRARPVSERRRRPAGLVCAGADGADRRRLV